jgi:hypothetical protein
MLICSAGTATVCKKRRQRQKVTLPIFLDRLPDVGHQPQLEGDVVHRQQGAARRFLMRDQLVDVGPSDLCKKLLHRIIFHHFCQYSTTLETKFFLIFLFMIAFFGHNSVTLLNFISQP